MYKLVFEKKALHDLNKLEKNIKERIWNKLQVCKENPFRFFEKLVEIGLALLLLLPNRPGC